MVVARCVVIVGTVLLVAAPVGAVRDTEDENDLETVSKPKICKGVERSGRPQFGVSFRFAPPGGCWAGNCVSPDAVFAEYIAPDEDIQRKNGVQGLIRVKLEDKKCKCYSAETLTGGKEYIMNWFVASNSEACTPNKCWHDFARRRFKPQFYTGELTGITSDDQLDSGNHWHFACESENVTDAFIEMPGLIQAKRLEEEEAQRQLEAQETARRERERIAEEERLERLRIQQEEEERERLRLEEEETERLRVEEEQRQLQKEAERERLRLEEEARQQREEKERQRLQELARQQREKEERLERERQEAREKAEQEARERHEEEQRRLERLRLERLRAEEERRRIQEEADRALALAAKAKGITIAEGSWKITLLWDTDNVDLDLHFYKKSWIAGKQPREARSAEISFLHQKVDPFVLDLDDQGSRSERREKFHVENVKLEASSVPDGEYVAFVELYKDKRKKDGRGAIPYQLILKGINGESGGLACKPQSEGQSLACSFDAPSVSIPVNIRHDLPEFDFKVTDGHLKFKEEAPAEMETVETGGDAEMETVETGGGNLPEYPADWEQTIRNLQGRFPGKSKADIIQALKRTNGHGGYAADYLK